MPDRVLALLAAVPFLLGAAAAPEPRGEVAFHFEDPAIVEASALVVQDGLVITSNDSGDTGRVFAVDPATGRTVGVTSWESDPTDVESLAPGGAVDGQDTVWVGDIGDNTRSRSTISVAQVPVGRGDRSVHPTVYDLAYPDGPHDAETLVRDPVTGRLYLASKDVFGGRLYALPATLSADHVNRLTAVGPVLAIATDGAFLPDGRHLVVRSYASATVYDWPSLEPTGSFSLPEQPQGEGIGIGPDGEVLLDSEGLHSPVLRIRLPSRLTSEPPPSAPPSARPSARPSAPPSDTAHPASPSSASSSAVTPTETGAGSRAEQTTAHHAAYWAVAALVLVVGAAAVATGRRRHGR